MNVLQQGLELRENLDNLRASSANLILLSTVGGGYVWFLWLVWPAATEPRSLSAWIGMGLLVTTAALGFLLKRRHLNAATHLLVWGILAAVACAIRAFSSPATAYLFVLPVVFASVLLSQRSFLMAAGGAALLTLLVNVVRTGKAPIVLSEIVLRTATIALSGVASWLSVRNLHTALAWVWDGYERARHNEEMARERQAELRRALKALDEATHRLERTNYMLALARDRAEEARRLKQEFVQNISHELRTPLNLIVGFTELMAQSPEHYGEHVPSAYLRDLTIVYRNACHLQNLVNDVLDLARIEAAKMSMVPEEIDPASLVGEAVETARSLVEARGLVMKTEVEPGLPVLWVDPVRIRQVLFNLLNNAARFTERGSVTVGARLDGEQMLFYVADTGVGISPEDISHIFEEFRQADGSTRRRYGGAGLGLAISRRFVELHGGSIWVESEKDKGSTFYFALPTEKANLVTGSQDRPLQIARADDHRASEEPILLAITSSSLAAGLLTRYVRGCRTVVVPDLEQAERIARELMPQAVVVDGGCDQFDVAELGTLGQSWGLPRSSFLVCPLPNEQPQRRELDVDGYLIKPVSRQSLWDVLRQFGQNVDRILVVDDDRDFVVMMSRMLDSPVRRYQVSGAYTGREGLDMLRRYQPDLVLLDLVLPDVHGFQVLERIRSTPGGRHIPVIIVSAQDEIDYQQALRGSVVYTKAGGLMPGEVIQWVQHVVDKTSKPWTVPKEGTTLDVTIAAAH
jgi:signal transduction histidine kinase/CheY-like chemotaxis protein